MTVRSQPARRPRRPPRSEPQRLSVRWFIIAIAATGAYFVGEAAAGPACGVFLACTVAGVLHRVLQ